MNLNAIRKANLRRACEEYPTLTEAAAVAGVTVQHLSAVLSPATPFGEKAARRFEQALGLPAGQLDRNGGEEGGGMAGLGDEELELARMIGRLTARERAGVRALVEQLAQR